MNRTGWLITLTAVIILAAGIWYVYSKPGQGPQAGTDLTAEEASSTLTGTVVQRKLIAQATYTCDVGKTISANFYQSPEIASTTPGEPPTPTGSVDLAFSDGTTMTLNQTISADGGRYANDDGSFVFWDKGGNAMVLQNGVAKDYTNCATDAANGAADYKNGTYTIDGQTVTLVNGKASVPSAPGSASQTVTEYFGDEATGDLNGDGMPDIVFILTQSGGGSGTFYYAVAALKTSSGYVGTNGVLLGDRIAPQSIEIQNGEALVSYADRKPTDPMTAAPSVAVTKYLKISNGQLVDVTQ